ncbi:MAG: FG-GAP repeat protein [Pirellulales bacterium]|nr:FG-GAP repeat protein [Pirellulales bacterium]
MMVAAGNGLASSTTTVLWKDSHKLTATGGGSDDRFGAAVAIRGNTALVGARLNDGSGSQAGAAYLFNADTGLQQQQLVPNDIEAGDEFGFSTALSDTLALVGAPLEDASGTNAGAAYLFDMSGNQQAKLPTSFLTGGEQFGYSVAIDGDIAVVGALGATSTSNVTGVAYVYEKISGNWQQTTMLKANDPTGGDQFGWSVALDGSTAIVGSRDANDYAATAYVFDVTSGAQLKKLSAIDAGDIADVDPSGGSAVAISGNLALVGTADEAEAAYLFQYDDVLQDWLFYEKLTASDGATGDLFGKSVGLSGQTAVVGAYQESEIGQFAGAAYFFNASTGNQIDKVTAFDGAQFDSFGYSVAVDGQGAVVGANFGSTGGGITGSAYLYEGILSADFEEDGDVDEHDLAKWRTGYGMMNPNHVDGDADLDGDVDGIDFLIWQRQFDPPSPSAALGVVPEPSSLGLGLAGLLFWGFRRDAARQLSL